MCFAFSYIGKMSKKTTLGFVFNEVEGAMAPGRLGLGSGGKHTALTLSHCSLLCEATGAQRFRFSYHRLGLGWPLPAWMRWRFLWGLCKLFWARVFLFFHWTWVRAGYLQLLHNYNYNFLEIFSYSFSYFFSFSDSFLPVCFSLFQVSSCT